MLDQRRKRWADVVQMFYKCFVFAEYAGKFHFYTPQYTAVHFAFITKTTFLHVTSSF